MKTRANFVVALLLLATASSGFAAIHYVDLNSPNPTPPYTNWAMAATVIQDAVDAAAAGDEVVVTNGIYATGGRAVRASSLLNRVAVDKPLELHSVNGPQFTVIRGCQVPAITNGDSAIRCVYLTNGASLSGFTLTNGGTKELFNPDAYYENREIEEDGGGVWCESATTFVSNCVLTGNSASGVGGGAYRGTFSQCILTGNWVPYSGYNAGGGASDSTLSDCTFDGNTARFGGGANNCALYRCKLSGNLAVDDFSAGGGASDSMLANCTLIANSAGFGGGGVISCVLNNCTLVGNSASDSENGEGGGAYTSILNNCILYLNSASTGPNYDYDAGSVLNYCCTTPMPTNGFDNITNAPLFVDLAGGDLRLQSNSPCINAGNNTYAPAGPDLDGNPRIAGGTVDIGAYEFQSPASLISYAWLQQYGLPMDGSADFTDPDGDGMNSWQEWRTGTDPTNAASALKMLMPAPTDNPPGLTISWQSVAGVNYFLQCSTNLSFFTSVAMGIPGQSGTTTFTDTNAVGSGPFFYRVGVGN